MTQKQKGYLRLTFLALCLLFTGCATSPAPSEKYQKWNSTQAIEAFKRSGLEAEQARSMRKPKDYGPAPTVAVEGTRFFIPSLGEDKGGRVFSFENQADLDRTKKHYEELGKGSGWFYSWLYSKDNILVQINGELPEEKAKKYEQALNEMK